MFVSSNIGECYLNFLFLTDSVWVTYFPKNRPFHVSFWYSRVSIVVGAFDPPFEFFSHFSSLSHSVVPDSVAPGLQHARPPGPSPAPRVYSNSGPSSWWCHRTISSCRPLLLLPSVFPSIRVFSSESFLCIRWPKYWSFSFSISPSNEYSGLISFRVDWLDLFTLKSLLQHHSSKASILWHSAFYIVQVSHPYMPTGKTIALTRWTFVGKVMSLLFIYLFLLLFAFIFCSIYSQAISFCFFSFFWDIFFFCATSSSGLGTICSFSVRIISMWQGELM